MALTQISTGGVKNDAVTAGKIPANAVGSSEIADDAVDQGAIADEAVDEARLQISNAGTNGQFLSKQSGNTGGLTWADANSYTPPNHSGEVTSTGDGATVIASNIVDEDNLKISNAGTNGQYLQKQSGNTGGLTWADVTIPPSGNTFTAVANGAIANNKAVKIDTDGKVSQVAESIVAKTNPSIVSGNNSNGTNVTGNNENAYNVKCCYVGNSKLLIAWVVDGYPSSGKVGGKAVIGSRTSEGDFGSFGSVFNWASNVGFSHTWDVSWDETNNTIIFSYRDDDIGSGKGYSRFCKYNTSTNAISDISSGNTTIQWRNASDTRSVKTYWDNSIQRLILTYQAGNSQGGHSIVMAKNSSDDSYGSTYAGDEDSNSVIQDQETCLTGLTSGKVVSFWNSTDGKFYYMIGVVNTSNNTISWGTKVQAKNDEQMYPDCAYNADKNIVAFTGRHTGGFNNPYIHFAAFNDSNSTIGSWTGSEINSGGTESTNLVYCPDAKNLHALYMVGSDPNNFKLVSYTHTTAGTAGTFNVSNHLSFLGETSPSGENFSQMRKMTAIAGHGAVAACARANTMNNKNVLNVADTTTTTSTYTSSHQYVGFADQAYTNGQTATIKTYGNNVTSLSGLTTGSKYYVAKDGTLSTSQDNSLGFASGNGKAGVALSSSKLLIVPPD